MLYLLAFLAVNLSEKLIREVFCLTKKNKNAKNEKTTLTTPTFFDLVRLYPIGEYRKILPKEIEEN